MKVVLENPSGSKAGGSNGVRLLLLTSQTELFDESAVARWIFPVQVLQEPASFADHHEQAAAAMKIFLVRTQMLGQLIDAIREHCDLDFR